ncbi:hypothetical protein PybrP1_001285 [[Pythium] brassicae (nom. inval.)]|nr:hypothetical protein PybrP1_001285 [[Pythium] brassicae (nom. inval.)]
MLIICKTTSRRNELYRITLAIQRFHMFEISNASPGIVSCRGSPELAAVAHDLRCEYNRVVIDGLCAVDLQKTRIDIQQSLVANPAKVACMLKTSAPVRPSRVSGRQLVRETFARAVGASERDEEESGGVGRRWKLESKSS